MKFDLKKFFFILIITVLVGSFFTFFTGTSIYNEIIKPPFAPKGFVFPIAWSIIYLLISISLYIVLEDGREKDLSLLIYGFNHISNWTVRNTIDKKHYKNLNIN